MKTENELEHKKSHKHTVRRVLAHSHSVYFILFLIGVTLDLVFPIKIFTNSILMMPAGFFFLIFGTTLIVWAERSSHNFKNGVISKENFCSGPYCFTRSPTHWGIFLLIIGFGFIVNAFFVVLFALISLLIEKFIFQSKAEKVLAEKYGAPYLEYKKMVRF